MGCFNGTCGLTQLPIKYGDKAVFIPLLRKKSYNNNDEFDSYLESTTLFSPLTPPIIGEYNDYGSIEKIENNNTANIVFEWFKTTYKDRIEEILTNDHDFCHVDKMDTVEDMLSSIERDYIPNVSFMMVHEEVYYKVIREMGNRKPYDKPYLFEEKIKEKMNLFIKALNKQKEENDDPKLNFILDLKLSQLYSDIFYHTSKQSRDLFSKMIDGNQDFYQDILNLELFKHAMASANKLWIPQCMSGQTNEFYMGKIIGEFMVKMESDKRNKYFEEWDENLDEEEIKNITKETLFDYPIDCEFFDL